MDSIKCLKPKEFPPAILEMADPPEKLYLAGVWPPSEFHFLTVVGSRRYSNYGREVCEKIIGELAGYPMAIVSGLAIGIDTIAHQAALAANLPTVAFPGSGLDFSVLHPNSNRRLAEEIVAAGGALVSEFEPLYPAGLHTFPRRNRLMAGASEAVLVIEAMEKSGTLITARLALDYNREVFAVPGSIFSPNSVGTHALIKQGAMPVTSGADILQFFKLLNDNQSAENQKRLFDEASPVERRVFDLLTVEPLNRDDLIRALGLPTSEANALLAALEIKGMIKESLGEIHLV